MQSDEGQRLWLMEIRYLDDIRFRWGWVKGGRYHTQAEAQAAVNRMERNWRYNMEFRITFTGEDMTDQELQEAIDKARAFISPQLDYKNTPSQELKDFTIRHIKELQAIQVVRAGMATQPTLRIKDET